MLELQQRLYAMNPHSSSMMSERQIGRLHMAYVIYALKILKHATPKQIKDRIDIEVERFLEEKYSSKLLFGNKKEIDAQKQADLKLHKFSKRTVQSILTDLIKAGKVAHDKQHRYYLTEAGYQQKLFGNPFGRAIFESLTEIPLRGTKEEKLLECVNRVGLYLIYIFMRGISFSWGSRTKQIIAKYDTEWINEAINGELIFNWFASQVAFDELPRTLKTRHYNDIMKCLLQYFPELLGNLEVSEMAFNRKFFEPEFMANKKWLDSFESKK